MNGEGTMIPYQEEGISKRSKLILLIMLLSVLSTILVFRYHEYSEANRISQSFALVEDSINGVYVAEDHVSGTIILPNARPGTTLKITALSGEWRIVKQRSEWIAEP
jgi:hypothetical protein